jgi:hypothetical protein
MRTIIFLILFSMGVLSTFAVAESCADYLVSTPLSLKVSLAYTI